ncbi:MAG: threonine-phosphate decarboxylase [Nitrospirae bacterium RBG_13_39_12]|nr:MAG: threonine-phosphate decarboxylase [Nitrospirae bacterium RBG_13_39_12]
MFNNYYSLENGGNIYKISEDLKIQERKVMDFSASVNPLGVSKKVKAEIRKHLKYLHNYPDPEAKRLRKRLAQYHTINPETILCGNGSTELIYLLARALKPQKVLMPAPTFSEYERAVLINQKSEGISQDTKAELSTQIAYMMLEEDNGFEINPDRFIDAIRGNENSVHGKKTGLSGNPCDIAFLCNPNNPTGRLLRRDDVRRIGDAARESGCYLVVDEAFMDFCADESVINDTGINPYLIVLRSMAGFYALAGLRLGYGVFPEQLISRLKENKEPWTVNNLSQRAALVALKDKFYRNETFRLIKEEKLFFEKSFKNIGIKYFDSDANFYLLMIKNADEIYEKLKRKAILVRDCRNFKGLDNRYLRVAVKSHRENTILIKELASILQK